jgi:hypothetical protein
MDDMDATPRFLQGIYPFTGEGLQKPALLSAKLAYTVPADKRSQLIYLRAGNSSDELIYLLLQLGGKPMRYFPIGAKSSVHVSLAVTEDIFPETLLEILIGAPEGHGGMVVIDVGLLEIT